MNDRRFDSLARDTETPGGRRHALKALGLAAVAAMTGSPLTTDAKKKKNKRRKKKRNRQCLPEDCTTEAQQAAAAICQSQVAACETRIRQLCAQDLAENEECLTRFLPCCQFLGTCDVDAFFTCAILVD